MAWRGIGTDYKRLCLGKYVLLKPQVIQLPGRIPSWCLPASVRLTWDEAGVNPHRCTLMYTAGTWKLCLSRGYEWDGSSAPRFVRKFFRLARNTKKTLRATLYHDALYEGMRCSALCPCFRRYADDLMWQVLKEDRYPRWKAWLMWKGVLWCGRSAAKQQ